MKLVLYLPYSERLRQLKFITRNVEVHKDIALVYGNQMAAECRLPSLVIMILSLLCSFVLALIVK